MYAYINTFMCIYVCVCVFQSWCYTKQLTVASYWAIYKQHNVFLHDSFPNS